MELLAVLKPDGVVRRGPGAGVINGLQQSGLCELLTFRELTIPAEVVALHYAHIQGRPFYPWLLRYLTSGPSYVILIETDPSNIVKLRELLGATLAHNAVPGTLRHAYAPYGGANCLHLSDSVEAASFEVPLWKQHLGVAPGQFDLPINTYISRYLTEPNNTEALRRICRTIERAGKSPSSEHEQALRALIAEEAIDASPNSIDLITNVIAETCLS
jgi:nucleoside-diphosphate kinase